MKCPWEKKPLGEGWPVTHFHFKILINDTYRIHSVSQIYHSVYIYMLFWSTDNSKYAFNQILISCLLFFKLRDFFGLFY